MPPIYRWPLRPLATLKWFFTGFLYPWGVTFVALACVAWYFLTPPLESMATLEFAWIALLWLRNAGLLLLVAGLLHWRLHIRRVQGKDYKFDDRWLATDTGRFLFRDQVRDNMFWSLASGVTIWTAWEVVTLWMLASGTIGGTSWSASPAYLGLLLILTFFWSSVHFDAAHRPLHWRPRLPDGARITSQERQYRTVVGHFDASAGTPRLFLGIRHLVDRPCGSGRHHTDRLLPGPEPGDFALRLREDSHRSYVASCRHALPHACITSSLM